MNTIAVFRARNDALAVFGYLKKRGFACATINTPAKLRFGCGLSVLFHESIREEVERAITSEKVGSFVGFFSR